MEHKSILIKDTTREERIKIVEESMSWADSSCEMDELGIDYDQYIDGKKELRELNQEYKANYIKTSMVNGETERSGCGMGY